jgi:hypothetical protein
MPSSDEDILAVVQTFGDTIVPGAAQDLAYVLGPSLRTLDPSLLRDQVSTKLSTTHKHFRRETGPQPGSVDHAAATFQARPTGGFSRGAPGKVVDLSSGIRSGPAPTHRDLDRYQPVPQAPAAPQLTPAQSLEQIIIQRLETQRTQTHVVGTIPLGRHMGTPKKR